MARGVSVKPVEFVTLLALPLLVPVPVTLTARGGGGEAPAPYPAAKISSALPEVEEVTLTALAENVAVIPAGNPPTGWNDTVPEKP
jgi:hypothetical protein